MPNVPSLESLRSRFRANGGPANLNADEQSRLLNHSREMELTETETQTLRTAFQLGGKKLITE
jgi:hypothetical protein